MGSFLQVMLVFFVSGKMGGRRSGSSTRMAMLDGDVLWIYL